MNSTKTKLFIAVSTFLLSVLIFGVWRVSERKITQGVQQEMPASKPVAGHIKAANKTTYEKVICTCEVGSNPASDIQIAEVKDFKGNILGVVAHVNQPEEVHLMVEGAQPKWDYLAVSARSATESIEIIHQPQKQSMGYDWILLLKGKGTYLKQKVKNCTAVSDE